MNSPRPHRSAAVIGVALLVLCGIAEADPPQSPITHGFLATGGQTYILDGSGREVWSFPESTRDGWVLPDGHVLLAISKSKAHPGGAAVEVDRDGHRFFVFEGTQSEVNTVQPLDGGLVLLTEAGDKPRLLEVDRTACMVHEGGKRWC